MELFEQIFIDLVDDKPVLAHKSKDSAVAQLVREYAGYSRRIERLPDMTPDSTGRDLKSAIALMAPEDQVKLAYHYYLHQGTLEADTSVIVGPPAPEHPVVEEPATVEKDEQYLRMWVLWIFAGLTAAFFFLIMGAALAYTFKRGPNATDDPVFGGLLSIAAKAAEFFLSIGD